MWQSNSSVMHATDPYRQIRKLRFDLDQFAIQALEYTESDYQEEFGSVEALTQNIREKKVFESSIYELSQRLDQTGLDDISRLLLSTPYIYVVNIKQSLDEVGSSDSTALYNTVLRRTKNIHRKWFLARLIATVFNARQITVADNQQWSSLDDLVLDRSIPIRQGLVEPAVMDLLAKIYRDGELTHYLDKYIANQTTIPETAFTPAIRQGMIDYLVNSKVEIMPKDGSLANGSQSAAHEKYFAIAYAEALKLSTVKDDPIDQIRTKGKVSWDFTIDAFDDADVVQGVIPDNIRAAGALDYVYTLGELMRVFDVGNALVLRWAGGVLDIPEGKTASDLYRFHKLRNERSTYEERAMLYKRVLNKGDGKLLSNMVANTALPRLWHKLMVEVTEYIRKSEGKQIGDAYVSRAQIYQATKNLQYNLTETMTGMAHIQVTEDYAHLQEAMNILKADEILNMFGGRRKTIWSVIEQVAKEDLGMMVPTAPLRTLAVEGNKIFQWVAEFNEGIVREGEFREFLSAAEAWIIAQASLDSEEPEASDEDDFDLNGNGKNSSDDDFSDWEV